LGTGLSESTMELTSYLLKITYPFIIFISLWAVATGVLNSNDIYFGPAFAPALSNLCSVVFIFLSSYFSPRILGPTIGFTVGGILQFLLVFYILRKIHFRMTLDFNFKDLKSIMNLFGPALLGVAVASLNTLVDTNIATWTGTGGVSTIQYALRIYQLPLSIFAISVANALLPKLSYSSSIKDEKEYNKNLKDSIELTLFFAIPSMFGLIFLNNEIVALIYQHGSFTFEDTLITAKTLLYYSLGLPFYSLHTIFIRTYHSKLNTRYPSLVAVVMLLVNATLDVLLAFRYGVVGIALATAISGIIGMFMTGFNIIKGLTGEDWMEIFKIFIASAVMSIFIVTSKGFFDSRLLVVLLIALSALVYFSSAYIIGSKKLKLAINIFFKRK
jgi:putative peptidoglycan lipid II flippase